MKNLLLIFVASAVVLASCNREPTPGGHTRLSVKLSGVRTVTSGTRALESAGVESTPNLTDGHIFVFDNSGGVAYETALDLDEARSIEGQQLMDKINTEEPLTVPSDWTVYILGNIPDDVDVGTLTSLNAIKAAATQIVYDTDTDGDEGPDTDDSRHVDYTTPPMANDTGKPATIRVNGEQGVAEVKLQPLYSRLELHKITGLNRVKYTVAGVYVDSYYSRFTMMGEGSGEVWNQGQDTDFTAASAKGNTGEDNIGDVATGDEWRAVENIATPSGSNVWAYHMASAGLPRLIIHLTNVSYLVLDPENPGVYIEEPMDGDRYITVSGYSSESTEWADKFERGRIYKVMDLVFDETDIGPTPNPTELELIVKIEVLPWVPIILEPQI